MTKSGPQNRKEFCLQREFSAVDAAKWAPESWHSSRNWAIKQGDISITERRKARGAGSQVCLETEVVTLQLRAGWGALDLQFHRVESLHVWLCWQPLLKKKKNTTYWEVYSLGVILMTSGTFSHWLFMTSLNVNQYYPHLKEQNLGNCHQNSWSSMGPLCSV